MQVVKQQKQLERICKGGKTVEEIEQISSLQGLNYFEKIYTIEKIKDKKNDFGFKPILGALLVKISILAGVKEVFDNLTKTDLVNMLTNTYGFLTIEEICKAFELERFGIYENKSEHFQQFNTTYVSAILKKYRKWSMEEKKRFNFTIELNILPEKSETQKVNELEIYTQELYELFLRQGFIKNRHDFVFDFLVSQNAIIVNENPKNVEWFQNRLKIAEKLLLENLESKKSVSKIEFNNIQNDINNIKNKTSNLALVKAKEMILIEFFEKKADDWITNIFN